MPKVGEQVVAEVQKCLCEHGFPRMSEERVSLLKGQATSVHRADHPVYKLIRECSYFFLMLLLGQKSNVSRICD